MSNQALNNLLSIFQDQPEILEIINLSDLESKKLIGALNKNNKLFASPVNLYVTGRTGAGKTYLGNRLIEQDVMKSTGNIDCTDSVGCFRLASNLYYFDLPGAGSSEEYENINRATLLMPQIEDEDDGIKAIKEFQKIDYSNPESPETKTISVDNWQSEATQNKVKADVILYVIAPHMQFIRSDKKYLRALLKNNQQYHQQNKVIFALNMFCDERTKTMKSTKQNIEDVKAGISKIYQEVFETQQNPAIITFNAKAGNGINEITSEICQILPQEKLGNIEEVLRSDLKEFAQKERDSRYLKTLIKIACRLASKKINEQAGGEDLLKTAAIAISSYGVETFKSQEDLVKIKAELNQIIELTNNEIKKQRTKAIKARDKITETKEITQKEPIFEYVSVVDYIEINETKVNKLGGFKKLINMTTSFFGLGSYFDPEVVTEKVRKPIERLEERFVGYETKIIDTVQAVVGEVEKIVGQEYLQGSYPVIKFILALGYGVQKHCLNSDSSLQNCISNSENYIELKLEPVKDKIEHLLDNNSIANTEQQLIELIENILVTNLKSN
ncbi:GTPase [Calothrix sp. PCC 6303]|uniref:GTPase n=1 Tax=Calothrix sp. PCC 6303 TaxID=1170562 RepID=UPI0002A05166|nr:GTPase [Calothrix sp. PCC 6303]AFY99601.1 hypothetical protein Cal6303_0527 [Calothrix sp. PCC 6303]